MNDLSILENQSLGEWTEDQDRYDYELHRYGPEWEIIAIDHERNAREITVALFPDEDQAQTAWEQIMLASGSNRGGMHFVSARPCWDIQWFNQDLFQIENTIVNTEGQRNEAVAVLESEGAPVKVTEHKIEHWSENPLFAAE